MPKKIAKEEPTPPTVIEEIRAFVAERSQVERALAVAQARVQRADNDLTAARRSLADAEAKRLIANPDAMDDDESAESAQSAESAEFIAASLKLEQARAALGGLEKRRRERDAEVLAIAEKLKLERDAYNAAQVKRFLCDELVPAAATYAAVLRRGHALAAALAVKLEPYGGSDTLSALLSVPPSSSDWQQDTEAKKLHDEHAELTRLAAALEHFSKDIAYRLMLTEKSRLHRVAFDPVAKYKVVRPFRAYGRDFTVGDVVDRNAMDLALMARVYEARRLQLMEPKDEWSR